MSEQKHTPGPWKVELDSEGSPSAIVRENGENTVPCACPPCLEDRGYQREGRTYSELVTCDSHVYGPSLADAHLIAAAPDLLAALVELVAAGQFAVESCDELGVMLRLGAATDAAHTAIAKAEGRS